jgi:hypothetical protein
MKKAQMLALHGQGETHKCAPKPWQEIPILTGDYDLDATIMHRQNPNIPARLEMYVKHSGRAYAPRNDYNSYHGYGGDN